MLQSSAAANKYLNPHLLLLIR